MEENIKIKNIKILERILKKFNINYVNTNLSYINRLFPNFHDNNEVILLCNIPFDTNVKNETNCEEDLTEITGSPLLHSFGDDSFDVTLTLTKRNWLKYEEKCHPIPRKTAITILNLFHEEMNFNDSWTVPMFALCDVTNEKSQVVLLGSHCKSSWFVTYRVTILPIKSLMSIQNEYKDLLNQHTRESSTAEDVIDITITSVYELCGVNSDMIDWQEQLKIDFKGYLKIEAIWNHLNFFPSTRGLSNLLTAEIMSGSRENSLYDMWNQILLLNKYLTILKEYRNKDSNSRYRIMPLDFPNDFSTPYCQDESRIMSNLNCLLNGDDSFDMDDNISEIPVDNSDIYEMKLINLIKELSKREDLDFTDRLWRIIRGTKNYEQMTDCIHTVFEAITDNNYKPHLNDVNETRFTKKVMELEGGNEKISLLAGSLSLELVIDMGMEKITRDYIYLLSNMNVMELCNVRKIFTNVSTDEFNIEKYQDKLLTLARINIALEFLQLIQSQLNCRCDITHMIFEFAFKKYCTTNSPLNYDDLINNMIYKLNMPAPKEFITAVTKMAPSSWMCTLSTAQSMEKVTTVNHYSRTSIFPPNIKKSDTMKKNQEDDEMYHVTTAVITYLKQL